MNKFNTTFNPNKIEYLATKLISVIMMYHKSFES